MNLKNLKNIIRALRLPFITASLFPFIFGSLLSRYNFNKLNFLLGLFVVAATHLSANLINDYADSKSGLDWQDKSFYKFFGGSKLIQGGIFSERFYFCLSVFFITLSCLSIIILSLRLKSLIIIVFYLIILLLSWLYSLKPLQFSYHKWGEVLIFILFGPAALMGGYFIQTEIFPTFAGFLLSLPFGFLTTAILFTNEVPDFIDDKNAGKFTWVSLTGQEKAFVLYAILIFLAFFSIALNIALKYLHPVAIISLIFIFPAIRAAKISREHFNDKIKLIESSRLTIGVHTLTGIVLILAVLL